MQHVRLGRTGLQVSRICLGTMTFGLQVDEPASLGILDHAAEKGITFLDTADAYPLGGDLTTVGRTEEIVGKWMKGKREHVYHAAMLDPHTAAELDLDQIHALVDELLVAHGAWVPQLS